MNPPNITSTESPDNLMSLMLQVAEMKGMLGQALSDMGSRITNNDAALLAHGSDISTLKTEHAATKQQVANAEHDIVEIKASQAGTFSRVMMVITPIVAVMALLISVADRIYAK